MDITTTNFTHTHTEVVAVSQLCYLRYQAEAGKRKKKNERIVL